MAYHIEGKDIVINGFEEGIADSPHKGISDIRNVDLISVPGEASVAFATANTITQTPLTSKTFTASSSGGLLLTWAGGTALADNTAVTVVNSGGALPTGLVIDTAYYVRDTTATTFRLALTAGGTAIAYTDAGTGTQSFSTINMGKPKFQTVGIAAAQTQTTSGYYYFALDDNGRVWYFNAGTQWVYMKNLGPDAEDDAGGPERGNGLAVWKNYLFVFRTQQISVIKVLDATIGIEPIDYLTNFSNWTKSWNSVSGPWSTANFPFDIGHYAMVGPTDDVLYFCNTAFIGSIAQNAGSVFAPGTPATYTLNTSALALPLNETAQCLAQLGTNLLVGGLQNIVYSWDRISVGYNPIFISENGTFRIVTSNTTAYFFSGQRGRIYLCNGSQAQLFKKMPDHLSGTVNPYYTWGDALTNRNQIYFGVQATNNAGVAINQYGGLWAIDLVSKAIRMVNQMSYGSYAGIVTALCPLFGPTTNDGFGLLMGWYTSSNTTAGIDKGSATPYTGGQSYVDSDLIPIGTFIRPQTPAQVEWKTTAPLVAGESVALYYRLQFTDSYTLINTSSTAGIFSDKFTTNFEKAQWLQMRAVLTSTASTPSYCRLTEMRIRDYPST